MTFREEQILGLAAVACIAAGYRRSPAAHLVLVGALGGLGGVLFAWWQEKETLAHPETMNAHFISGGTVSALGGMPGSLARARSLVRRR